MMTLLGSLLGFLSAAFPDVLKFFQDKADRRHELEILEKQMKLRREESSDRLQAVGLAFDAVETQALYKTYKTDVAWVDALNGTVRPVLAYAFFFLYAAVKYGQAMTWVGTGMNDAEMMTALWNGEDQAIFAGIISFYFGQRAMRKMRGS